MLPHWQDLTYLQAGSAAQQAAYHVLLKHAVLPALQAYSPTLAGTFPLDIAVPGSDLDILCEVYDFAEFGQTVARHFGHCPGYSCRQRRTGPPAEIISFQLQEFEVELFGQSLPVAQQYGYRHMVVEARLLTAGGSRLKERVIQEKTLGLKTEPAFAKLLALPSDAYQALLALETADAQQLRALVQQHGY
jgi:hypothetical protein